MPEGFHRRSIRLRGYDYANEGAYYLTICTHERSPLFGRINDGVMHASPLGDIVQRCWDAIPEHMPHADVGEFVVMPNHVHGIVIIRERALDAGSSGAVGVGGVGARHDAPDTMTDGYDDPVPLADARGPHTRARHDAPVRDPRKPPGIPNGALGQIVASYKSAVTRMAYRDGLLPHGTSLWQRNYWDRVIRDDGEYERIAKYIRDNPTNWGKDRFNR